MHQFDNRSLQSRVCASVRARHLKLSGDFSLCDSCLAIHVTLIASEHFQISLKNNMPCTEPWGSFEDFVTETDMRLGFLLLFSYLTFKAF